jgi:hypothetical protein
VHKLTYNPNYLELIEIHQTTTLKSYGKLINCRDGGKNLIMLPNMLQQGRKGMKNDRNKSKMARRQ